MIQYRKAKTIVTNNRPGSWFGYEYNMNIYRGCTHGCIYCDSRCSCYGTEDFDTIQVKERALEIIRNDLRRKAKPGVVCTGAMSDPYNTLEAELQLTRHALELIHAFGFGTGIITKSDLVTRDIDVLAGIQEEMPVLVNLTITTTDQLLADKIEPGASAVASRLEALSKLTDAGIFAGVMLMPVLPFLEDREDQIQRLLDECIGAGARFIYMRPGVTLRGNQRNWYYERMDQHFPGVREKYEKRYGERIYCNSPRAGKLMKILEETCQRHKVHYEMDAIKRVSRRGYGLSDLPYYEK